MGEMLRHEQPEQSLSGILNDAFGHALVGKHDNSVESVVAYIIKNTVPEQKSALVGLGVDGIQETFLTEFANLKSPEKYQDLFYLIAQQLIEKMNDVDSKTLYN